MNLHDLHYSLITDDVIVAISNSGAVKVWTLSGVETRVGHYLDILKFCFISGSFVCCLQAVVCILFLYNGRL